MSDHYILDGHTPVAVDLLTWARWLETAGPARIVAQTHVSDTVRVSTVFLGLNHQHFTGGPLEIFETMIFGGPHDSYMERYATWDEADAGHLRAVALATTPAGAESES